MPQPFPFMLWSGAPPGMLESDALHGVNPL
jgi:hypothetical protein